ncbi:hypothetical protein DPMN_143781 [Dreissena polymorpha]|uniref:Uncharacterized protein n=1 Tax=Dreissena polymorpha TaxID=45954 RepID=A0A9D4GDP2_DREPO|nr:hypothetical protein DPMN_143781 [Dreissena polymorpha]
MHAPSKVKIGQRRNTTWKANHCVPLVQGNVRIEKVELVFGEPDNINVHEIPIIHVEDCLSPPVVGNNAAWTSRTPLNCDVIRSSPVIAVRSNDFPPLSRPIPTARAPSSDASTLRTSLSRCVSDSLWIPIQ